TGTGEGATQMFGGGRCYERGDGDVGAVAFVDSVQQVQGGQGGATCGEEVAVRSVRGGAGEVAPPRADRLGQPGVVPAGVRGWMVAGRSLLQGVRVGLARRGQWQVWAHVDAR